MFQWEQPASIQGLHVTFTDADKDGLADALPYSPGSGTSTPYANTSDGFVAQPVGAFASVGMGVSAPLAADVVGSGNAELYCLVAGKARTCNYGSASPRAHTAGRYLLGYQPTALGTLPAAPAAA
ncbi:hypothetical protein [Myxococcus qinghaiensis]|uniref:hypothetical protein n=1 Tax=Myxococcus qinghaiensis TaxID=2906758 RepID=UPI0020A7DD82|nr:hypothetical protein [Myxococcus qinghaiensis]MCP3169274.1 hypothetical protein [Myxococcus qinghaiensis]